MLHLSGGDAPVQYGWVQRLYGDRGHASGYFFGLGLVEAPFYGVGRVLRDVGVYRIGGFPVEVVMVSFGTGLVVVPAAVLVVRLVHRLGLRAPGASLLAAGFGTSLVFWVVFSPGKNHPADAALFTIVLYLTYRYFETNSPSVLLITGIGATLGFSITRYFSGAEAVALVAVLAFYRRWRDLAIVTASTAAVTLLLFAIPVGLHTPIFSGTGAVSPSQQVGFYPLNPLRMLFTNHRGLFVWSPVTIIALGGLVWLFRNRAQQRPFLLAGYAMAAAIAFSYVFVPYWDGALSFGQRYYTPLIPLVVIGLAAALTATNGRARMAVATAVTITTA